MHVAHLVRYLVELLAVEIQAARHVRIVQQQPDGVSGAEVDVICEDDFVCLPHPFRPRWLPHRPHVLLVRLRSLYPQRLECRIADLGQEVYPVLVLCPCQVAIYMYKTCIKQRLSKSEGRAAPLKQCTQLS